MPERHHHHHHHHHWRDQSSYAHRAGAPGPGPNIHRLRRLPKRGKIAGVCVGVADYFGWSVKWTRIAAVLLTVFFFPVPIFVYVGAAIFMKPGDEVESRFADKEEEKFWRTFSTRPRVTFSELKHRFRALDARIADLETAVTSNEYGLRKAFRDLERGV